MLVLELRVTAMVRVKVRARVRVGNVWKPPSLFAVPDVTIYTTVAGRRLRNNLLFQLSKLS